jgi:hypothetical protein
VDLYCESDWDYVNDECRRRDTACTRQFEHAIHSVNLARVKRKEKKRGETWFPFNFV